MCTRHSHGLSRLWSYTCIVWGNYPMITQSHRPITKLAQVYPVSHSTYPIFSGVGSGSSLLELEVCFWTPWPTQMSSSHKQSWRSPCRAGHWHFQWSDNSPQAPDTQGSHRDLWVQDNYGEEIERKGYPPQDHLKEQVQNPRLWVRLHRALDGLEADD